MHILHFFVPHKKNNHRAKLLHNFSLLVLTIAVAFTSTFAVYLGKTNPEVLGVSYQISNVELLNLTNYERQQEGLAPLSLNEELTNAAKKKSGHMFKYDYWAHFAPDGTSPWDFIRGEGYDYSYAGENLAKGFTTSFDAVKAWMNSPTHRENILSDRYSEVGFSIEQGKLQGEDTILIVQEFGNRNVPIARDVSGESNAKAPAQYQIPLPEGYAPIQSLKSTPTIDITSVAKTVTFILLASLLVALVLDFIIIEKNKIPRSVGNNLDHVILVTVFIAFLLMAKFGHVI